MPHTRTRWTVFRQHPNAAEGDRRFRSGQLCDEEYHGIDALICQQERKKGRQCEYVIAPEKVCKLRRRAAKQSPDYLFDDPGQADRGKTPGFFP